MEHSGSGDCEGTPGSSSCPQDCARGHHMLTGQSFLCPRSPGPRAPCSCLPLSVLQEPEIGEMVQVDPSAPCAWQQGPGWRSRVLPALALQGHQMMVDLSESVLRGRGLWHGQGSGGEGWYVTVEPEAADLQRESQPYALFGYKNRNHLKPLAISDTFRYLT